MAEFIVIPSLEFLKPYSDATKSVFGMTFSVAMNKARTLSELTAVQKEVGRSFLQPWTWGSETIRFLEVEQLRFLNPSDGAFRDWKITPQNGIEALNRTLARRFELFEALEKEQDLKPWAWGSDGTTEISKRERPWPAFVAELSLYPRPLPQSMRLSFQGQVSPDFWTQSLVAAPILRLKLEGGSIDLFPNLPAPTTEKRVTLIYEPKDPALLPLDFPILLAETKVLEKRDLISDYFDFGDLWVRGETNDLTDSNWRAGLEERLAGHLQLGQAIVDFMKDRLKAAAESKPADRAKILDGLAGVYVGMTRKALLRVQAATIPYLENGFPGGHLLGRLAPLWRTEAGAQFEAATARSLAGKAAEWFKEAEAEKRFDDWILWISPEVEGVQRSRILGAASSKGPGIASLPMEDAVAELDQLAARLFTPETLGGVFKNIWSAFLTAKGETLDAAEKGLVKAFATRNPVAETNLSLQLLQSNVGRHWNDLVSAFQDKKADKSRNELTVKLGEILVGLGLAADWAQDKAGKMAASVIPLSLTDVRDASRPQSLAQQGITIQVDTINQDQATGFEDGDLLRYMQGVGLLMRKTGTTAWRCLNLGAACIGERVIAEPVLLPSRIAYMNDLRDPTVLYDNAPLTVRGPLSSRRVSGTNLEGEEDPVRKELDKPLIEFTHAGSDWKIPGLVFGHDYDVLPFLVTNSGAIPKELAAAENAGWGKGTGIKGIENAHVRKGHQYRRAVHVGALRFRPVTANELPQIPPNVAPRVRELSVTEVLPEGDPLRQKSDGTLVEGVPLLLLAPESFPFRTGFKLPSRFEFEVSPPTADLETWDRWVALKGEKDRRKFAWRSFYELSLNKGESKIPLEDSGIYLDDPAVKAVWAELVSLSGNTREQTKDVPLVKKAPAPDLIHWGTIPADLKSEQSKPLKVECAVDSEGGITVTIPGVEKPLTGKGGIYRLSFYATLENGEETRFAWTGEETELVRKAPKAGTSPGTSPWHLLIEVPKALPAEKKKDLQTKLYNSLQPDPENAKKGMLAVKLDMNDVKDLQGLVYRAELQHQVWSWRGRPPADHPDVDSKGTLEAFQMSEFGERSDDGHRVLPLPRTVPEKDKREPSFLYTENLNKRGPQGDARALFHRFSARVFSRWEGILQDEDSYLEAIDNTDNKANRWRPLFVPCRHVGDVPVPKVKMVLPLTQGKSEAASGGPGLMVVVDGPWYEVGGLAETLEVEVVKVADPKEPVGKVEDPAKPTEELKKSEEPGYLQIGTDPIVTAKSAGQILGASSGALSTKEEDGNSVEFKDIDGAIGHHRDHSQTDPRFLASSFLLSRPTIKVGGSEKTEDISWWFLKLRFRRALGKGKRPSEWSAPFWVQVLPGVERVEEYWFGSGSPEVSLDADGKKLKVKVTDKEVEAREKEKKKRDHHSFYLFAVMTRKVIDFAGRPDQEAYVGVWVPDGNSWKIDAAIGDRKDLFIRWIEVQSSQKPDLAKGEDLWDRLFKADLEDSKRMRIVRISRPFKVNS